jgi:hypothetical protein
MRGFLAKEIRVFAEICELVLLEDEDIKEDLERVSGTLLYRTFS